MEFLNSFAKSLGGSTASLLVYAAIIAVFIVGLFMCIFPVIRTKGLLKRAIRSLKNGTGGRRSWQEDDFLGKGVLSAHWSEYLNNLFFADGVYHNASNVEDYINEETVIDGPGRSAFCEAIPSLLVSIGFLGTLIGLAQGLSGFSMDNSEAVMGSIVTLIPGMRYAFMTSIFGVIGSVGFTLITRAVNGSTEHTLRNFYGAIARYAGVLSVDPLTQVAIYQQDQTAMIKQLSEDLSGKLKDNVASAMSEAIEPLNQTLRSFVTVTSKEQMRFLDAVVTRFVDRMDESLDGQIHHLARSMREVADYQDQVMESVHDSVKDTSSMLGSIREVARIADDMVRRNAEYIDSLRTAQRQAEGSYQKMADAAEQMELVARQQSAYLKTVSAMQAEVSHSVGTMTDAVKSFTERFAQENTAASESMRGAAEDLRRTGEELRGLSKDFTGAVSAELRSTLDAYQDYVNEFTKRVDYLSKSITDSLANLPGAVSEGSETFLDQIDKLNRSLSDGQRALDEAVDRLYGARRGQ